MKIKMNIELDLEVNVMEMANAYKIVSSVVSENIKEEMKQKMGMGLNKNESKIRDLEKEIAELKRK